ncbi:MAG: hypothetical protein U1C48_09755 [Methylotenera sp.]|nr:hypothetical protein [Methylotenera sp.]
MTFGKKISDRLNDSKSAIEKNKMLLSKLGVNKNTSTKVVKKKLTIEKVSPEPLVQEQIIEQSRLVTIEGNGALKMYVEGQKSQQHLSPAMRKLADACLEASQNKSRNVLMFWPGNLECLPFAHMLASIEKWANGYKRGMRTIFYPATQSSFHPLNHIKADRESIHQIVNNVLEVSFNGNNPAIKENCPEKDLMLLSLNSLSSKAKEMDLLPCLNELFPHFHLKTGDKKELLEQSYKDEFLSHMITKLSKRGHTESLRRSTLPYLGNPSTAPDAMFALSYQMKKDQLASSLRNINNLGAPEVIIIDATQASFRRTENLRNRITSFLRQVDEIFNPIPGIVIVTDDPQQMVQLRTSLKHEVDSGKIKRFSATKGVCHPIRNKGLESELPLEHIGEQSSLTIKIEVTDKEAAKLIDQAYRYRIAMQEYKEAATSFNEASSFLRTISNLPSSRQLLNRWLDDSLADSQQRRRYDWLAHRNKITQTINTHIPTEDTNKVKIWLSRMDKVIESYGTGTPLSIAMASRIADYGKNKHYTLVILANPFYVMLAEQFFRNYGDGSSTWCADQANQMQEYVKFISARNFKEEIHKNWASRIIISFINADLLRLIMTDKHIPAHIDFLLTQNTATYVYHSLKPVLDYQEFSPYHARAKMIIDQLSRIGLEGGAVLPSGDMESPVFSSSLPPRERNDDDEDRDMIKITINDDRVLSRGLHSNIYIYDPAALESHDIGFRIEYAEKISVGDQIFVMSEELHDLAETIFKNAGVNLDSNNNLEKLLRLYHSQVLENVKKHYPGSTTERVKNIRAAIIKLHPNLAEDLNNIRYWIDLENCSDKVFNQVMPQAPRSFEHFQAFLKALSFEDIQIKLFWDTIRKVRGDRIIDGRNFGDHYSRVLFDPNAAQVYDKLPRESLYFLRDKARENIYQVVSKEQLINNKENKK